MTSLEDIRAFLLPLAHVPHVDQRRRATPKPRKAVNRDHAAKKGADKLKNIAVLDMETIPFDAERQAWVEPFVAELYSPNFDPIVIWNDDFHSFIDEVIAAIEGLPHEYTIFAHNGGKFDWQFLLFKLRGQVSFKGRGIMSAKIGRHTIRDSFHLLPEALKAYRKDPFDYSTLVLEKRHANRDYILDYLHSDCVYLFELLNHFIQEHGLKISIGQAAMAAMRAAGCRVERLGENTDAYLRHFYFGGRVECIQGKGLFDDGEWKLYDVNSMYPFGMAAYNHPIGRAFEVRDGEPGPKTVFIELECENHGAFVARGPDGETSALNGRHTFKTTIHEYKVAMQYGLIENVKIKWCIDFEKLGNFSAFVVPRYDRRQQLKKEIRAFKEKGEFLSSVCQLALRNDLTEKYLLNNAYGKYAQNPRKYKDSYITDVNWRPPTPLEEAAGLGAYDADDPANADRVAGNVEVWDFLPAVESRALGYAIWERPSDVHRFNNVATAASITGACRAVLLEAICNAVDPIYCDTDSLICRDLLNTDLHESRLGAWDLEDTFTRVIITGKKTYGCDRGFDKPGVGQFKIRSKGTSGLVWRDLEDMLDADIASVFRRNPAPTLRRDGTQGYIGRRIRATAGPPNLSLLETIRRRIDDAWEPNQLHPCASAQRRGAAG